MTVDYRANDPATGRTVVLTVPSAGTVDSPELLARFYREARAAGGLQHKNIIAIYDLGVDRGSPFITRELLEGSDLGQIVEREKQEGGQSAQSAIQFLNYIVQACEGLAYAHQHRVIHRNVRPESIFVTRDGRVKLTHFVNARLPEASSPISAGIVASTSDYMAPEQISGDRLDGKTDIWAVGCTIYEVLTYETPFHGESVNALMFAIMSQEPEPISKLRPDLPGKLDSVVRRTLRKDRSERYQKVEDLLADLEAVVHRIEAGG